MYKKLIKTAVLSALTVALTATTVQAQAPDSAQGRITVREYIVGGPNTIERLTSYAGYPDSPDATFYPNIFEWPAGPDGKTEDVDDPASPPPESSPVSIPSAVRPIDSVVDPAAVD